MTDHEYLEQNYPVAIKLARNLSYTKGVANAHLARGNPFCGRDHGFMLYASKVEYGMEQLEKRTTISYAGSSDLSTDEAVQLMQKVLSELGISPIR